MKKTLKSATAFLLTAIFLLLPFFLCAEAAMTHGEMLDFMLESNRSMLGYRSDEMDYSYFAKPYGGDAYAALNKKAKEITASCSTDREKAYEINKWVADNVYYDYDYYYHGKTLQSSSADDVFEKRITNCAGYAGLMNAMCRAVGLPSRTAMGTSLSTRLTDDEQIKMIEARKVNHEWVDVYFDGKWNTCDPTWDSLNIYENGEKNYYGYRERYFAQSVEDFSKDHFIVLYYSPVKCGDYMIRLNVDQKTVLSYSGKEERIVLSEDEVYANNVFSNNKYIKEAVLPESMTEIPSSLFSGCTSLEKVSLGSKVKIIGASGFSGCSALTEINVPASVEEIKYNAFFGASSLKTVYYGGTKTQWSGIKIGNGNQVLSSDGINLITSDHKHTFTVSVERASTCKEKGIQKKTCSSCGYTERTELPLKAHSEVVIPAVKATCSKTGLTEGKKCSACGLVTVSQKTTQKLSHTFTVSVERASTCKEKGIQKKTCSSCGYTERTELPLKEHSFVLSERKEPSCAEEGKIVYTCSVCGGEKTETLPKITHTDSDGDSLCDFCGISMKKDCSCFCHKDGFYGFIYKIMRFFWKIFGTNKTCDCGAKHY